MNVAVVTPWPLTTVGGTQTLLRRLSEELLRRGVAVTAFTGARGVDRVPSGVPDVRLPVEAAPSVSSRVGTSTLAGLEAAVARLRPDVVLYAPHHSHEAHQAAAVARSLGARFAYLPLLHADERAHTGKEARSFARAADLVLCVTEGERRFMEDRAGVAAPVIVGAGSDLADAPLPPPRPGPRRALLTVGSLSRLKRHEDQVEALALLPEDTTLTVCGSSGDGEARLRARIERLGLAARVRLFTGLPGDDLVALHREADVFVFTSRSESLGVALLDAICGGTFPVAYPHPVYGGLVEAAGFGILAERETPRALARALLRARDAPRSAAPAGAFRAAHAWSAAGGRLADALAALLASPRTGR